MDPIRLAVVFDEKLFAGGGYQQALNAALNCRQLSKELVEVVYITTVEDNINTLCNFGIKARFVRQPLFDKLTIRLRKKVNDIYILSIIKKLRRNTAFEKQLLNIDIDLVYFVSPSNLCFYLEQLNYISTVWDMSHRDDLEFPEFRLNREIERRDQAYKDTLPRAMAIFVDSDFSKDGLTRRYGIDSQRVHVLPFQGAVGVREFDIERDSRYSLIDRKYGVKSPYVFYPAQFWAHKNHVYILEGLKILEEEYGIELGAVFAGNDKDNYSKVKSSVEKLGLSSRVTFVGFLENDEVPLFYKNSLALVMPSYCGPTNLPPLEAFELGTPVLYPDKEGLRDQVGNAALLMDLDNPRSLAKNLKNLIENSALRTNLIKAGFKKLDELNKFNRLSSLESIIRSFQRRRSTWL